MSPPPLAGATVYVALVGLPVSQPAAAAAGFATCFVIRALALHYGWSLPAYKPRPGRTAQEVEEIARGADKHR